MINYEACRVKEIIERDYHKMRDKKISQFLNAGKFTICFVIGPHLSPSDYVI